MRRIAAAMIVLVLASALGGCIIREDGGHGSYGGGDYHWHPG
jgi:hypothetical protein